MTMTNFSNGLSTIKHKLEQETPPELSELHTPLDSSNSKSLDFVAVLGDDSDWLADYAAAEYTDVDLWIPKLDTESSFGREALVQYLMDRGTVDAFNADTADFSRMADYPWFISDILQKAKIKTDEEGLEAAAVTMVMIVAGALLEPEEPQYREFHANEPFRYYIVTTQTPMSLSYK